MRITRVTTTPTVAGWLAAGCGRLLDLVLPSDCPGCQRSLAPGSALCPSCAGLLGAPRRVGHARPGLPPVFAVSEYAGGLRRALLRYKERGRRDLAAPFGAALAEGVRLLEPGVARGADGWWLVPAPSRPGAARRRGGDHVLRLVESAAALIAAAGDVATVAPALRLAAGTRDSVGLDAAGREANLAGRVLVNPGGLPPAGTPVLFVDDLYTTGATAAACVSALNTAEVNTAAILTLSVTVSAGPYHSSGLLRTQSAKYRRRLIPPTAQIRRGAGRHGREGRSP